MGRFSSLAQLLVTDLKRRCLPGAERSTIRARAGQSSASSLQRLNSPPLSPQPLEPRRMLDASAAGLVLPVLIETVDTIQASENLAHQERFQDSADLLASNTPPSSLQLFASDDLFENDVTQLFGIFVDPDMQDTHVVQINWGDGSPPETITLSSGARFFGTSHQYLDDNPTATSVDINTITVTLIDNSGGMTSASLPITVKNVPPKIDSLSITSPILEGGVATLTGTYSDPGSLDTFELDIDWDGDSTIDETITVSGGTFSVMHQYLDNDADNLYAVTIALSDDDGGFATQSILVFVTNVNPALMPITATPLDSGGTTFLTIEFADPGTESLTVLVDWGDKLHLPPADRFVASTVVMGPGTQNLTLVYTYSVPPDPLHPAADIEIRVKIRDDDFDSLGGVMGGVVAIGESNLETVLITNPGEGVHPVFIDTTPQVPLLVFPRLNTTGPFLQQATGVDEKLRTSDFQAASGEIDPTTDRYLVLQAIYPDGDQSEDYRLPPEVLNNLPKLFIRLPEYQYVIYVVREETNTRRIVIEVFSRNGRLIDPGDDFEGARDRPPTDKATRQPVETIDDPLNTDETDDQSTPSTRNLRPEPNTFQQELLRAVEQPFPAGSQAESGSPMTDTLETGANATEAFGSIGRSRLAPAIAGLVAASVAGSWASQIDRAVSQASPLKWRRLRRRNRSHRKNRP